MIDIRWATRKNHKSIDVARYIGLPFMLHEST